MLRWHQKVGISISASLHRHQYVGSNSFDAKRMKPEPYGGPKRWRADRSLLYENSQFKNQRLPTGKACENGPVAQFSVSLDLFCHHTERLAWNTIAGLRDSEDVSLPCAYK